MTTKNIEDIIHLRLAVYQAGANAGMWKPINLEEATGMMGYIFPKSGVLAIYHLLIEAMRRETAMTINAQGSVYTLFKLPAQVEKELVDYLKVNSLDINSYLQTPEAYLESVDTIVTDHGFMAVNIGSFNVQDIDNQLRLCVAHYRYSFEHKLQAYPYFD